MIIEGEPAFEESNLRIVAASKTPSGSIISGSSISISADVFNRGSTGIDEVELYIDGKILKRNFCR